MFDEKTAIKMEFRIPEFYWGDGIIIFDGQEFYGAIANDLILGTINTSSRETNFSIYFNFPCEDDVYFTYLDQFDFHLPSILSINSSNNVQGINEDNEMIIGTLSLRDIYCNYEVIKYIESFVNKEKKRLNL